MPGLWVLGVVVWIGVWEGGILRFAQNDRLLLGVTGGGSNFAIFCLNQDFQDLRIFRIFPHPVNAYNSVNSEGIAKFPFGALGYGKGLAAQGGILCFVQNDGLLLGMTGGGSSFAIFFCLNQDFQDLRIFPHSVNAYNSVNSEGIAGFPFGALGEGKGLVAQGGILRFAQNDRLLLGMTDTGDS